MQYDFCLYLSVFTVHLYACKRWNGSNKSLSHIRSLQYAILEFSIFCTYHIISSIFFHGRNFPLVDVICTEFFLILFIIINIHSSFNRYPIIHLLFIWMRILSLFFSDVVIIQMQLLSFHIELEPTHAYLADSSKRWSGAQPSECALSPHPQAN